MPSSDTNNFISAETAALLRLEELRAQTAEKQEKIEELKIQQQEITVLDNCMKSNSNCWQDLQKNNTTALDKVVETTNYVVKANGEGLDKMICGNEIASSMHLSRFGSGEPEAKNRETEKVRGLRRQVLS